MELPLHTVLRLGEAELLLEPVPRPGKPPAHGLIGEAPATRLLAGHLERIAPSDVTVMLLDESSTGKELAARALHHLEALRVCNHHRGRAGKLLGLSRSSFFERLNAWEYGHEGEQAR